MKSIFVSFALAAGLAAAQDFSGQPECALPCLAEFVPQAGCALTDSACQCAPGFQAKLTPLITPCIVRACSPSDINQALSAAEAACAAVTGAPAESASTTVTSVTTEAAATTTIASSTVTTSSASATGDDDTEETDVPAAAARHGAEALALVALVGAVVAAF